ncbi:MAG: hypothetical protein IT426_12385 [Pirellulales bacterium]|nr:hypothetical protein [Pirellulales bacterium]
MRIVINHLTRMHGGHICAAGVDLETRRHVRPVLEGAPLPFYLLSTYGGPFAMARILDLGSPRPAPVPPHVEDHVLVPACVKTIRRACPREFWKLLDELARPALAEIFGDCLRPAGQGAYAAEVGAGQVSLGCLRLRQAAGLFFKDDRRGGRRLRIGFNDGLLKVEASVTDLRLFADDHATPNAAAVRAANQGLSHSRGAILCVGLTRPYSPDKKQPERHWLQVNNLHLEDDPLWTVE